MRFLRPKRNLSPELLDLPACDPGEVAGNLQDIARVNRYLGGASAPPETVDAPYRDRLS